MPYNDITTIQNPVTHINETDEWLRVHGGGE